MDSLQLQLHDWWPLVLEGCRAEKAGEIEGMLGDLHELLLVHSYDTEPVDLLSELVNGERLAFMYHVN